jgi:hypothetical protein
MKIFESKFPSRTFTVYTTVWFVGVSTDRQPGSTVLVFFSCIRLSPFLYLIRLDSEKDKLENVNGIYRTFFKNSILDMWIVLSALKAIHGQLYFAQSSSYPRYKFVHFLCMVLSCNELNNN